LPPSRLQVLSSKFLLALLAVGTVWAVHLSMTELVVPKLDASVAKSWDQLGSRSTLAAGTVLLFGASWLGSAVLNSPASATIFGIAVALGGGPLLVQVLWTLWAAGAREMLPFYGTAVGLTVGSLCVLSGSAYFLRRVEP
jgi:hypothetical protein